MRCAQSLALDDPDLVESLAATLDAAGHRTEALALRGRADVARRGGGPSRRRAHRATPAVASLVAQRVAEKLKVLSPHPNGALVSIAAVPENVAPSPVRCPVIVTVAVYVSTGNNALVSV